MGKRPNPKNQGRAFIKEVEKVHREKLREIRGGMRSVAGYLYTTLRRSFRPLPKTRKKGRELHIYYPGLHTPQMTVEEFLKGAYRAYGSGSFQKEKVQTFYKGTAPVGTYHEKNQKPGVFFTKGTGRFSQEERENIQQARNPHATQKKIMREIREKEKSLRRAERESHYKTWSDEQRTEAASAAKGLARDLRKLKKKHAAVGQTRRKHEWRIVARSKHDVQAKHVQTHIMIPTRSKPGEPPRSDPQKGHALKKGLYYKTFPLGFGIYATSLYGDHVYRILEFGGTAEAGSKRGDLLGYTLGKVQTTSKDGKRTFSHKRVSLRPKLDNRGKHAIRVEPRPFFAPARDRAVEKIQEIFGGEAADFVKRLQFF